MALRSLFLSVLFSIFISFQLNAAPALPWNSGEIYSDANGWLKSSGYHEAAQLFAKIVLDGYIDSPSPRSKKILFKHFGYDFSMPFLDQTPPEVKSQFYSKFPSTPLINTRSMLGGYQIGVVMVPPDVLRDEYILSDEYYPLDGEWYDSYIYPLKWRGEVPANMVSKIREKKWSPVAWAMAYAVFKGSYELEDIVYATNSFFETLSDGTIVIVSGLARDSRDGFDTYEGTVKQHSSIYVLRPVTIKRGTREYLGTMVYYIWFFEGASYYPVIEKGREYVEKYIFPPNDESYTTSVYSSEIRRFQQWSEQYIDLMNRKTEISAGISAGE